MTSQLSLFVLDVEPAAATATRRSHVSGYPSAVSGTACLPTSRGMGECPGKFQVCVLGSGSGGNSTAVRLGNRVLLIDMGLGPRTMQQRLQQAAVGLDRVEAVCLTHLDQDHFRPSCVKMILQRGIRLYLHQWHRIDLMRIAGARALIDAALVHTFADEAFEPVPGLRACGVQLQHDRHGTIGYRFDSPAGALGYATDLGHVPHALIEHLAGVEILCLESNYDELMTIHCPRPSWVNRRNMSDSGHLSNEQAFDAVRAIAAVSARPNPQHILLMHRSQQCNHPRKVRCVFEKDSILCHRIHLTEQRHRTRWFVARRFPSE